jgi:hypothetical protein
VESTVLSTDFVEATDHDFDKFSLNRRNLDTDSDEWSEIEASDHSPP